MYYDHDTDYLTEKAEFSILPTFKRQVNKYPELREYEDLMEEIENNLSPGVSKNIRTAGSKLVISLSKCLNAMANVDSVLSIAFLSPITYIVDRLLSYAMEAGRQHQSKNDIAKAKVILENQLHKTKDKRQKAKLKDLIAKCNKTLDHLENYDREEHIEYQVDLQNTKYEKKKNKKLEKMNESAILLNDCDVITEKMTAEVQETLGINITPLVNKYPELKKYNSVAQECDDFFKKKDMKNGGIHILRKLNLLLNQLFVYSSDAVYIASLWTFNIPGILISRAVKLLSMMNDYEAAEEVMEKNIATLKTARSRTKNVNEQKKIDKLIAKCENSIKHLRNDGSEEHEQFDVERKKSIKNKIRNANPFNKNKNDNVKNSDKKPKKIIKESTRY